MAHPHPYAEATAALFISTAPVLAVVGLLVGERIEAFKRRPRQAEPVATPLLAHLEAATGLE